MTLKDTLEALREHIRKRPEFVDPTHWNWRAVHDRTELLTSKDILFQGIRLTPMGMMASKEEALRAFVVNPEAFYSFLAEQPKRREEAVSIAKEILKVYDEETANLEVCREAQGKWSKEFYLPWNVRYEELKGELPKPVRDFAEWVTDWEYHEEDTTYEKLCCLLLLLFDLG